jgi:HPt (histidine-containing phosphotransfer) domain-containing protein
MILDQTALDNIRHLQRAGAPNILDRVVGLYVEDAPRQILAMRNALATGDRAALERAAHTLKSSSANLGALELAASCKDIEINAHASQLEKVGQAIDHIELDYAGVCAALSEQSALA